MSERYVGWRCGKCDAPIAGAYATCGECGFRSRKVAAQQAETAAEVDPRIGAAVAAERERCAKIAETCAGLGVYVGYEGNPGAPSVMAHVIARKIRRGE